VIAKSPKRVGRNWLNHVAAKRLSGAINTDAGWALSGLQPQQLMTRVHAYS